jgi:TonB family protein
MYANVPIERMRDLGGRSVLARIPAKYAWAPRLLGAVAVSALVHGLLIQLSFYDDGSLTAQGAQSVPSYSATLTALPKPTAARLVTENDPPQRIIADVAGEPMPVPLRVGGDTAVGSQQRRSLPPATAYKLRGAVDTGPSPLTEVEPKYPDRAGGVQGRVVLRLLINEFGIVDDVAVASAFPEGLFEESALAAFRAATFAPATLLGRPVKSQITIEVQFQSFNKGAVGGRLR